MDNKRFYKKISTFFWFALATCPLWISFFMAIFSYFGYELTTYNNTFNNQFESVFYAQFGVGTSFEDWVFPFVYLPIDNLIGLLGLQGSTLALVMAWFIQVYMLELLCDIFTWVQRWIHNFLSKWGV